MSLETVNVREMSSKLYGAFRKAKTGWFDVISERRLGVDGQPYWGRVAKAGAEYLIKLPEDDQIIRVPTKSNFETVEAAIRTRLQELHARQA